MDTPEKNLDYFLKQFNELADDARDHGLSLVVVIENSDPIARQASVWKVVRGTMATTIGLLHYALMDYYPTRASG